MLERLSLNQATTERLSVAQAVAACARAGLRYIGLWRHKVAEQGLAESARLVREAGLQVSSLCRGGMFPAASREEREARLADNRRAVDEAVALGTDVLVLVCGGLGGCNLSAARAMVEDAIDRLVPYAAARGVKLGIEPLHPMYAADRSVINTLAQALDIAERYPPDQVGVVIDAFHVWWDPDLYRQIERARGRILGLHVCDWLCPLPDVLLGRGMMGDGVVDLHRLRQAVDAAGYTGPIEVEIFNQEIWDQDPDQVLMTIKERFLRCVAEG